jgi:ribosomal protein S18 acetylase RimI-like enzyme
MFLIRPLLSSDQAFLWDALHVALWDPPPAPLRPREILQDPHVRIYAEDWGRVGDLGVVAVPDGEERPVGACWMRRLQGGVGFGYVDDETPQLGIAVLPAYQGRGLGRRLMAGALSAAWAEGIRQVALTVHPANPARRLYECFGFRAVEFRRTYHLMLASAPSVGGAGVGEGSPNAGLIHPEGGHTP